MKLIFADQGWDDICHWIETDRKVAKRLLKLTEECKRTPF